MQGKAGLLCCFVAVISAASSQVADDVSPHIVGGTQVPDADIVKFKYMGTLTSISGRVQCGAFLASPTYVITAAHCVGQLGRTTGDKTLMGIFGTRSISIAGAVIHPNYDVFTRANDIAVLKVQPSLSVPEYLGTIPLAGQTAKDWTDCTVSGYGATVTGGTQTTYARYRNVVLVPRENCPKILDGQICVAPSALCSFDGGDPLVSNGELVGIGISDRNCANNTVDVYLDISKYKGWVEQTMSSAPTIILSPLTLLSAALVTLKTRW